MLAPIRLDTPPQGLTVDTVNNKQPTSLPCALQITKKAQSNVYMFEYNISNIPTKGMKRKILLLAICLFSCMPPARAEQFFQACSRQIASEIISNTGNKKIDDYYKNNIFDISGKNFFTMGVVSSHSMEMFAKWNSGDEWLKCFDENAILGKSPAGIVCGNQFRFSDERSSSILPSDPIYLVSKNGVIVGGRYVGTKIIACEVSTSSPRPENFCTSCAGPAVRYPYLLSWISKVKLDDMPKEFYLRINYKGLTVPVNLSPDF